MLVFTFIFIKNLAMPLVMLASQDYLLVALLQSDSTAYLYC